MNPARVMMLLGLSLVLGCKYNSPLSVGDHIPIDHRVLGLWQQVANGEIDSQKTSRLLVLRYSDTEYLIHDPVEKGLFYRGHLAHVGGHTVVQLEIIGDEDGPPGSGDEDLFHVVTYTCDGTHLEIRYLNEKLVRDDVEGTDALRQAFLSVESRPDLFVDPARFARVEPQDD